MISIIKVTGPRDSCPDKHPSFAAIVDKNDFVLENRFEIGDVHYEWQQSSILPDIKN